MHFMNDPTYVSLTRKIRYISIIRVTPLNLQFLALKQASGFLSLVTLLLALTLTTSGFTGVSVDQDDDQDPPTNLERISWAERSDGNGYVVRLHMRETPTDFKIWQGSQKLTQIALFKEHIIPGDVELPEAETPFVSFELNPIPDGVGLDITLEPEVFVLADAYLDANGKDVLINLESSYEFDVEVLTEGLAPIDWAEVADTSSEHVAEGETDGYQRGRDVEDDVIQEFETFSEDQKFDTIVIDPGHGGRDPGAIGNAGTYEKDVALAVAHRLGGYINEHMPDIEVVYTREDDTFVGLEERGSIANEAGGDLFISLHANSAPNRNAQGTEVYILGQAKTQEALEVMKRENRVIRFEDEDERSEELSPQQLLVYEVANSGYLAVSEVFSGKLDQQFADRAQRNSRGIKQAPFIVLYHASMPAILVEMGFISNPQEERFLSSEYGQSIIASAIFRAIRDYRDRINGNQRSSSSE